MNQEHWRSPLSSGDPAVVEKSMEGQYRPDRPLLKLRDGTQKLAAFR
jgi:hypothetical protein